MKLQLPVLLPLVAISFASVAFGQNATTTPVGVMTVTASAGSISAPKLSSFSLPLFAELPDGFVGAGAAKISGVTANSIVCAGAGWLGGALSQTASPFLAVIKTGPAEGYVFQISSNTSNALTVLTDSVDLSTLGIATSGESQDTIEIYVADTLLTLFGNGTADGANGSVMGGTSTANSDLVTIHNGSGWKTYYFNLAANQWREGNFNRNNFVILPRMGITFQRRASSQLDLTLVGRVPSSNLKVRINNAGVSYVSLCFPVDVTLGDSGFENMPGFAKNLGNLGTADKIQVWNGSGWKSYNFSVSFNQWREGNFNRNSVIIPAGTPIQIVKAAVASGSLIWTFPIPYSLL